MYQKVFVEEIQTQNTHNWVTDDTIWDNGMYTVHLAETWYTHIFSYGFKHVVPGLCQILKCIYFTAIVASLHSYIIAKSLYCSVKTAHITV